MNGIDHTDRRVKPPGVPVSKTTELRRMRKYLGLCTVCEVPSPGRSYCVPCSQRQERYDQRKDFRKGFFAAQGRLPTEEELTAAELGLPPPRAPRPRKPRLDERPDLTVDKVREVLTKNVFSSGLPNVSAAARELGVKKEGLRKRAIQMGIDLRPPIPEASLRSAVDAFASVGLRPTVSGLARLVCSSVEKPSRNRVSESLAFYGMRISSL